MGAVADISTIAATPSSVESIPALNDLLQFSPDRIAATGLAKMSLICATDLPGSEDLHIPAYLARLKQWAAFVRKWMPAFEPAFQRDPSHYNSSPAIFKISVLVQILKKNLGVHYNPARIQHPGQKLPPFGDSRDLLINGPLGPTLAGTCNNIPMIVVAVGRELGYPVYLAANAVHVYVKWHDPDGESINVETTNAVGMNVYSDEHYENFPVPMLPRHKQSGYYLKAFSPVDELALCLVSRGWILDTHQRYAEAASAHWHACRLAPKEPMYPNQASRCVGRWLCHRHNQSQPAERHLTIESPNLALNPHFLLPARYRPLAFTILARYHEINGGYEAGAAMRREAEKMAREYSMFQRVSRQALASLRKQQQNDPLFSQVANTMKGATCSAT